MALDRRRGAGARSAPLAERLGFTLGAHGAWRARRGRRQHGARDPHDLGRARPRPAPLRADAVRRRGAAARARGRRGARHPAGPGAGGARHPVRPGPGGLGPQGGLRRRPAAAGRSPTPRSAIGSAGRRRCEQQAEAWFEREEVPAAAPARSSSASTCATSARTSSCAVPFDGRRAAAMPAGCARRFFAAHETAYGYHNPRRSGRGRQLPPDRARPALPARRRRRRSRRARRRREPVERRAGLVRPDEALDDAGLRARGAAAGPALAGPGGDRAARCDDAALPGRPRQRRRRRATS